MLVKFQIDVGSKEETIVSNLAILAQSVLQEVSSSNYNEFPFSSDGSVVVFKTFLADLPEYNKCLDALQVLVNESSEKAKLTWHIYQD